MRNYQCRKCKGLKFKTRMVTRFCKRVWESTYCKKCGSDQLEERRG
jgi:hypothetical protein